MVTATSDTDAELIRLAARGMISPEPSEEPVGELIAKHAANADAELGDSLVRIVLGARMLRRRLAVIEVEAANQAREAGVTVRRLSEATGISERNVRQRFRRPAAERARP